AVRVPGGPTPPTTSKEITKATLVAFLRTARHWAVSSIAEDGRPQSAVVGIAVGDGLELVFDTLDSTNKARNVGRDGRVSLVMWAGAATAQLEGTAELTSGEAQERAKHIYFASFPDGRERTTWPGMQYVAVRPTWIRISDFAGAQPTIVELDAAALAEIA
ncbi:MAG: pyridoxamine 5'-phosphate oxidase family protein, partial [Myxococcales bacterium]|nr:pyridoxamine 5'-phosphate oxidase family protein [Myxococcales bacterium]